MDIISSKIHITKLGAIILVCTIILSFSLIIAGVVDLSGGSSSSYEPSNDSSSKETVYWAYDGSSKNIYGTSGNYYTIKFVPNSSGSHSIKIDGAYIVGITNDSGSSVSYSSVYDNNYENAYTAYLYPSYTYSIRVCATSSYISFLAEC